MRLPRTVESTVKKTMSRAFNTGPSALLIVLLGGFTHAGAQATSHAPAIAEKAGEVRITSAAGVLQVEMIGENILRVDVQPGGKKSPRTLVLDPALKTEPYASAAVSRDSDHHIVMGSERMRVVIGESAPDSIAVLDADGDKLAEENNPFGDATAHSASFLHRANENLYGMRGLSLRDNSSSLLRNAGSIVAAGAQGDAGGPWFFTTRFGVLIDSDGGTFDTRDNLVQFSGNSRDELEYFVIVGPPLDLISGLATLTGKPPLPPKWSLGFLNSQWGIDEAEARKIAATYRAKQIPLDAFIFDFDWKAWGEDNYGEWRWNSTSTPESYSPDKFPDGAGGAFAKEMGAEGIKLAGILKPRVLLYKKNSTTVMHVASAYAQEHHLWYPGEPVIIDYVTGRQARDLDFSKAETRQWYWKHLEPAFDAGMVGWWNDEADETGVPSGQIFDFGNFQFMNMGRALYEGQRGYSNRRVWSINRNYYLGAQRYGYAEWSGDIQTGFQSMARQRARMDATLDLGEPHWSMDAGGFFGHPTSENYARWVEFAAFVPIDRVHGGLGEKRQPWIYGPVAEAAAVRAIRLRYQLLPYIYSYEHHATETGIGIVRPLFWVFPDDPKVVNDSASWMFGDALLVSPVVVAGETEHDLYLPAGTWFDYFRGTHLAGGQEIHYAVDPKTWQDIPLFIRSGSILASRGVQNWVDEKPATEITLDVFADSRPCQFTYYDDDGNTYAYEKGADYRQTIHASSDGLETELQIDPAEGTFHSALQSYLVQVHGVGATSVLINGKEVRESSDASPSLSGWTTGRDRFGVVTTLRVAANGSSKIVLRGGAASTIH